MDFTKIFNLCGEIFFQFLEKTFIKYVLLVEAETFFWLVMMTAKFGKSFSRPKLICSYFFFKFR